MSALTFNQIQDDVLDLCQEIQGQTDFTLKRVKHLINKGYYDFARRAKCIEKTVDITTVANQETYTFADAANLAYIYHIHTVKYIDDSTKFGVPLSPYPGGYANLPENKIYGTPVYYYTKMANDYAGVTIGTYPICSSSSETIRIVGFSFPQAELSADGDVPHIKPGWRDALTYYTVSRLFRMYEHLNPRWERKANTNWALYMDIVQDSKFNLGIETEDDFPETIDVYA